MKLKNLIVDLFNHERYQSIAFALVFLLLLIFIGCEPTVTSIMNPGTKLTRSEFEDEVNNYLQMAETKAMQLDKQDAVKNTLYQIGMVTLQTGRINPIGLITAIAGILGTGAAIDNVRKRRTIKRWESSESG